MIKRATCRYRKFIHGWIQKLLVMVHNYIHSPVCIFLGTQWHCCRLPGNLSSGFAPPFNTSSLPEVHFRRWLWLLHFTVVLTACSSGCTLAALIVNTSHSVSTSPLAAAPVTGIHLHLWDILHIVRRSK